MNPKEVYSSTFTVQTQVNKNQTIKQDGFQDSKVNRN